MAQIASSMPARSFRGEMLRSPFLERVKYFRERGGDPVPVACLIEDQTSPRESEMLALDDDEYLVTWYADEDDAELPGIKWPLKGDRIERSELVFGDNPEAVIAFTGEIVNRTSYSFRCRFKRTRMRSVRGQQMAG